MSVLRRVSVASQVAVLAFSVHEGGSDTFGRHLEVADGSRTNVALQVVAVMALLGLSGLFAGLGLGLMSLDLIGLEIVVAAGQDELATDRERKNSAAARRIIPIRKQGNLLLTTLLLGNVSVNALTSILMADFTSGEPALEPMAWSLPLTALRSA
jgi:CBS domain containing-hemolysin-like protein